MFAATAAVPLSPGTAAGPPAVLATLAPTFAWSAVAGVNGYRVRVVDLAAHTDVLSADVAGAATQYTATAGTLPPGRVFAWTVLDLVGKTAGRSPGALRFVTPTPPAPAVTAPAGGLLATVRPTFAWSAVPGVSGYLLHIDELDTGTALTETVGASATTYTPAAGLLKPGAAFAWNVRGLIGTTPAPRVSPTARFRLPPLLAPTPVGPGATAGPGPTLTTFTPTFGWTTAVAGFSSYRLDLADLTAGTTASYAVPATATSYTLATGLLVARHRYAWNLRLVDGTVTSLRVSRPTRYFVAPRLGTT